MSEMSTADRKQIIEECYRLAESLDWESLSNRDKSRLYDSWLDLPEIGGRLTALMSRERARVWLKDVPMKEYSRARAGIGSYAQFVTTHSPTPDVLAKRALGVGWSVDGTTPVRVKPTRAYCESQGQDRRLLLWGKPENLRDLIWASLVAIVDEGASPVVLLVCSRAHQPTELSKARDVRIGSVAGIEVKHTTVA